MNTPVYRGSTVLFPTLDALQARSQEFTYGRRGNPNTVELERQLASLEGGERTILTSSGFQAVTTAILACVRAGDDVLVTDSVYQPTRQFCDTTLSRLGVRTIYYDPLVGAGIGDILTSSTRLVWTESPGSQTFEIQDIPAIVAAVRSYGSTIGTEPFIAIDNTWASPLLFRPFEHGVDISVQSLTKYVVGHSDALLGAVTATGRAVRPLIAAKEALGVCPGAEETWLALRGLRTLDVRLTRHAASALELARWLQAREEVAAVLYPALPGAPGHDIWRRDFIGASGLFTVVLQPVSRDGLAAMVDGLRYFGMGYSWGGFESLAVPFDPRSYRTATVWKYGADAGFGPAIRLHVGLEDVEDLKADLDAGFARMTAAAAASI